MISQVFEQLLYSLDQQGLEDIGDNWRCDVGDRLQQLRQQYDILTDQNRSIIDYSDLATQTAYTYAYAIGRAEFTYQLLTRHRAVLNTPIFAGPTAKITSLGGGPGSEIAGVVRYLLDEANGENVQSIQYWIFDKEESWTHPCNALIESLSEFLPIKLDFQELDLCDTNSCEELSLKGDDLLILSFVISELCALRERDAVLESLRSLYKTMDSGSSIFYNDSSASSFYYFFNDSRKFVKGLGKESQKNEIFESISASFDFGDTYCDYNDAFESTPHMTSDALSKFLTRL